MQHVVDFLKSLYNADRLLGLAQMLLSSPLGIGGLLGIIFAETGLLVGFFLPGDSLLFSVGVASGAAGVNVYVLAGLLMCAAIIGDNIGYFLGRQAGPRIFSRPKSRFFHPDHLKRTKAFYEKYGARAIVYARFIPIIRTCTPFVSGVAEMPYPRFFLFSLFGGTLWIGFMMTLGYRLGQVEIVRRNFEKAILGIIFISLLPMFIEGFKAWRGRSSAFVGQAVPPADLEP
ncbi:MAG TPA: VTT domain-containing protein [Bryobacteraceae bacterium]|nr:VTT domain-containing protein [Bryobacteraceae bacterium]